MKADVGSLLFIQDKIDSNKKRPHICIHVFTNDAGIPYNWLVLPITSIDTVGKGNLVEVKHRKLKSTSYAKLNNIISIPWNDNIEVAKVNFAKKYAREVTSRLACCLTEN